MCNRLELRPVHIIDYKVKEIAGPLSGNQMPKQISHVNANSAHLFSLTKILRLVSLILVGLSFVVMHFLHVGQVGSAMHWSDEKTSISAGSHPYVLFWTAAAITLFVLLMVRKPGPVTEGVPSFKRRVLAFVIDFWFGLLALSSVGALIPLSLEAERTGHFEWHFQRNFSVNSDGLSALSTLFIMFLMILYFAFPLTRGRQTVGCFIMRLRVLPPFGDEGCFTLSAALKRSIYSFIGLCSMMARGWGRDEDGRTWYDRTTGCIVVLVSDS